IHDNWGGVVGLRGTGSCDFSVENYHLPEDLTFVWDLLKPKPRRGGPSYLFPPFSYVAKEHGSVAIGAARRAARDMPACHRRRHRDGDGVLSLCRQHRLTPPARHGTPVARFEYGGAASSNERYRIREPREISPGAAGRSAGLTASRHPTMDAPGQGPLRTA